MPREKPLLIYDGECSFCAAWVNRWRPLTGTQVDYAPFQEVASEFPQISQEDFRGAVKLIEPGGRTHSAAEAVFQLMAYAPGWSWMRWIYRHIPGARPISERVYRWVAAHRSRLAKFFKPKPGTVHFETPLGFEPAHSYRMAQAIFLRGLGAVYIAAFLSLAVQIKGLVGEAGIQPASEFLSFVSQQYGPRGFHLVPTLFWFWVNDFALQLVCWAGAGLGVLLLIGWARPVLLFLLWLFYLSLVCVGGDFLSFQWDSLLLETGLLAIFIAHPRASPPQLGIWLFRFLLFKLTFSSGVVKLASGDPTWANFAALICHYQTQPLPTPAGWFAHQLLPGFQKFSCGLVFFIELAVPLTIFAPRRLRLIGCGMLMFFQALIMLTGNYAFFNWLTVLLCLWLIDDAAWPRGWMRQYGPPPGRLRWVLVPLSIVILLSSTVEMVSLFKPRLNWFRPVIEVFRFAQPFRSINGYGLFAVMTTTRPEIILEGSRDGQEWLEYEFKYKPGDLRKPPGHAAPHQPRLDWQMWFAALTEYSQNDWFLRFCEKLLQGSKPVEGLLKKNPFPDRPPKYIRATLYDYHFTDLPTLWREGKWWRREKIKVYCPPLSLES